MKSRPESKIYLYSKKGSDKWEPLEENNLKSEAISKLKKI